MGSLRLLMVGVLGLATIAASPSLAQRKYDPGASDSEIKIGNIMPYSGPISSYSVIGKTEAAYFEKINAEGGINGRKIKVYQAMTIKAQSRKTVVNRRASLSRETKIAFDFSDSSRRLDEYCHREISK